jgi:transposase
MDVLYPRCGGLDLHKKSIVACRILPGADGAPVKELQSFGTMTAALLQLADWLAEAGVTHVAMESTGVYWKPVYNLLEDRFTLLLVNAAHIKAVPGRKSDLKDAEWIADLLRHGLLAPSFVPPRAQRELRELTRYRTSLVQERAAEVNRLQKSLEGANIKLASVVSDVTGRSAREILAALVRGQTQASTLAQMARGRLREKLEPLEAALKGSFGEHQRFLVGQQLAHLDDLEKSLEAVSQEIERRLGEEPPPPQPTPEPAPLEGEGIPAGKASERRQGSAAGVVVRLQTIPGVGPRIAQGLIAEIGTDMSRFASAGHLASWAGMTPGQHESAGKVKSCPTRKGNRTLRCLLVEASRSAGRTKGNYLSALYQRQVRRLKKKGVIAVGRTILEIAYHLIRDGTVYKDLGADYFVQRDREKIERRAVRDLKQIGYDVILQEKVAA